MTRENNASPTVLPARGGIAMHAAEFIRSARARGMSVRVYAAGDKISSVSRDSEAEAGLFGDLGGLLENDFASLALHDDAEPGAAEAPAEDGVFMDAGQGMARRGTRVRSGRGRLLRSGVGKAGARMISRGEAML